MFMTWAEDAVFGLVFGRNLTPEPINRSLWAAGCEIIPMHCARDIQPWMVKVAGAGFPDFKANRCHEARAFFLPVLRSVSGTIDAQIEPANHPVVARLSILDRDLYVYKTHNFRIKVGAFDVRA